ncbi:hypothetical protein L2E82_50604 [Cichorium intybus]|nr:hypothetical protein L2E82_50604 [Cichorium intybus]
MIIGMTSFKTINMKSAALVILLLATFHFTSSEGRALSLKSSKGATTHHGTSPVTTIVTNIEHGHDSGSVVTNEGDFRPTTPGHSPGAGHSTGPTATFEPQP